jgi:hypothetical protein
MISRTLALGLLSTGCIVAAAGGSYLAVRHNNAEVVAAPAVQSATAAPVVQETEAVVKPAEPAPLPAPSPPAPALERAERPTSAVERKAAEPSRRPTRPVKTAPVTTAVEPPPAAPAIAEPPVTAPSQPAVSPQQVPPVVEPAPVAEPVARPAEPVYEEIVVPATSVIGLEIETTISTERARVEDRVDARVTRDVYVDGRTAIPAGSRVIGAVTLVERGGKVKERARLGVRFHTLVLAGGRQVDLRTEPIYREGESPVNDSSKKIGGAAIGGAVLGAILGGGKGAITGATVGAAGGTAAVMAGDRKPATLTSGSVVTVKLAAPATLEVER